MWQRSHGLCRVCGHDLRVTPNRCLNVERSHPKEKCFQPDPSIGFPAFRRQHFRLLLANVVFAVLLFFGGIKS